MPIFWLIFNDLRSLGGGFFCFNRMVFIYGMRSEWGAEWDRMRSEGGRWGFDGGLMGV